MVCQWGMSDKMGMVQYGNDQEQVYMGRDMAQRKDYSEFTAQEIDAEVKRIINEAYTVSKNIIDTNRDKLEIIANALLEYESLDGEQVGDIVRTGTLHAAARRPQGRASLGRGCSHTVAGSAQAAAAQAARLRLARPRAGLSQKCFRRKSRSHFALP